MELLPIFFFLSSSLSRVLAPFLSKSHTNTHTHSERQIQSEFFSTPSESRIHCTSNFNCTKLLLETCIVSLFFFSLLFHSFVDFCYYCCYYNEYRAFFLSVNNTTSAHVYILYCRWQMLCNRVIFSRFLYCHPKPRTRCTFYRLFRFVSFRRL